VIPISAAEGYELWADSWDETPSPIVAVEERALRPWMERIRARRAVDIGCGTGRWTARLHAMGIDASPAMLAVAARKPGLHGRLAVALAGSLPIASACADLVLSTLTFGHIRDQASAMSEFARILEPGGTLIVTDFHPDAAALGWRRTFRRDGLTYELENHSYTVRDMQATAPCMQLSECVEANIDEPERPIFVQAGKPELFEAARRTPAVLLTLWSRL
jgi:malonyl-CoA O-methyltransferase